MEITESHPSCNGAIHPEMFFCPSPFCRSRAAYLPLSINMSITLCPYSPHATSRQHASDLDCVICSRWLLQRRRSFSPCLQFFIPRASLIRWPLSFQPSTTCHPRPCGSCEHMGWFGRRCDISASYGVPVVRPPVRTPGGTACQPNHGSKVTIVSED